MGLLFWGSLSKIGLRSVLADADLRRVSPRTTPDSATDSTTTTMLYGQRYGQRYGPPLAAGAGYGHGHDMITATNKERKDHVICKVKKAIL